MEKNKICIVGLGFVGLTLALTFTNKNIKIIGIEINKKTVKSLKQSEPHFFEKGLINSLKRANKNNLIKFSNKILEASDCNVFVITVGTPLNKDNKPNFSFIERCTKEIISLKPKNPLIILRSTVAVGTTRNVVIKLFSDANIQADVTMCPERTMAGFAMEEIANLPQIISGQNSNAINRAKEVFSSFAKHIIKASSIEAAELIKLADNSSRDLYFSISNELAFICESLNLNAYEIIKTANDSYPRTNLALPGLVGGPCLEKDPLILYESLNKKKYKPELFYAGRMLNKNTVNILIKWINELGLDTRKTNAAVLGLAFKGNPETSDLRGSLAIDIAKILDKNNFKKILLYDPMDQVFEADELKNQFPHHTLIKDFEEIIATSDIAIISNNHTFFSKNHDPNNIWKINPNIKIFDFWNNFGDSLSTANNDKYRVFGIGNTQ